MELVKGVPITDYCDARKLTPRERLELFVPVCQAIQHAHQKGVIHRDVKPSNVLIALYDDRPVPKVIDFGIAKAAGAQLTDHTIHTGFGGVVGTPQYMSPEQATLNNLDIDTRSDVYSLGVLLYELLTGSPPFARKELRKAGLLEILRVVREEEPPRPSTKLSTADALPSLCASRGTEPKKLMGLLRNELDWIVMKALEKDRSRRYETANGFAADVNRYLSGEAVQAHPPGTAYRVKKLVRRNRGQVIAAGLVLVALLAGIAGTTAGLIKANRATEAERGAKEDAEEQRKNALRAADREAEERRTADAAMVEAQAKEAEANAVVRFFQDNVFAAAGPKGQNGGLGKSVTLREAIIASLPALAKGFTAQPLVEARLRHALGVPFLDLGDGRAAADQFERARAIYDRQLGPDHGRTLKSLRGLANSYELLGRHADALRLREEALAGHQRTLPPEHPDTISTRSDMASSYFFLGRSVDAMKLRQETLAACERTLPPDHPTTLLCTNNLAVSYQSAGRYADALRLWEKTRAGHRRTLPPDHPDTLRSMYNVASIYESLGRKHDALRLFEETLSAYERTLPPDHSDTLRAKDGLARSYNKAGRIPDAIRLFEETLTAYKRALPADHSNTLEVMENLANSYRKTGRVPDSIRLQKEALAGKRRALPLDDPGALASKNMLAAVYLEAGKFADALPLHEEALATCRRIHPPDHPDTLSRMNDLALSYSGLGRHREAVDLIRNTTERSEVVRGAAHPKTLFYMWTQVEILFAGGRSADAVPVIDECVRRAAGVAAADPNLVPAVMAFRLRHFRQAGDSAGCRQTADTWEKLNRPDVGSLFGAACFRAVTAGTQAKTPGADAAKLAKDDADRAMRWLHQAVQAGFQDAARMKKDPDLDPLRQRGDFKDLLASIAPREPAPPREKK